MYHFALQVAGVTTERHALATIRCFTSFFAIAQRTIDGFACTASFIIGNIIYSTTQRKPIRSTTAYCAIIRTIASITSFVGMIITATWDNDRAEALTGQHRRRMITAVCRVLLSRLTSREESSESEMFGAACLNCSWTKENESQGEHTEFTPSHHQGLE
jgi:hypothetical protein